MISVEKEDFGTFLMINIPWIDGRKGIGLGNVDSYKLEKI